MSTLKNILITGASSLLMQELIKKINKNDFNIWAVTRNKSKINIPEIRLLVGDICEVAFIDGIIKNNKIDIVIHAAAVTHSYIAQEYFDVNLQSTINLVVASKRNNVKKFIFISSRAASKQSGAYGFSKLKAEEYIKSNFSNWLIIRPSEIFGGKKGEGIDKLINDLLLRKIILCPVNMKSKLFPLYITDAAQIIYDLIFDSHNINKGITVNGKEGFSYYELIRKISKIMNKKVYIIPVPKFTMYLIKWSVELLRLKVGIVADQISRLYSYKETGLSPKIVNVSIEKYAMNQSLINKKLV